MLVLEELFLVLAPQLSKTVSCFETPFAFECFLFALFCKALSSQHLNFQLPVSVGKVPLTDILVTQPFFFVKFHCLFYGPRSWLEKVSCTLGFTTWRQKFPGKMAVRNLPFHLCCFIHILLDFICFLMYRGSSRHSAQKHFS